MDEDSDDQYYGDNVVENDNSSPEELTQSQTSPSLSVPDRIMYQILTSYDDGDAFRVAERWHSYAQISLKSPELIYVLEYIIDVAKNEEMETRERFVPQENKFRKQVDLHDVFGPHYIYFKEILYNIFQQIIGKT